MADRRLSGLIAGLAAFLVCAIVWNTFFTPSRARRVAAPVTASTMADSARAAPAPRVDTVSRDSARPPAPRLPISLSYIDQLARAEARRRIRASAGYTYLSEMVDESRDSALHRWEDRYERAVRVYLPGATVANFQPAFLDAVRSAFERWQEAGVPVRFNTESDSERAEVQFRWRVQFEIARTGQTDLTWDPEGRIQSAVVTMASFDPQGRPLTTDDVHVVALHEIGHLLGLDHSADSTDIMFANTVARDLSPRDIRTALMLYQLAPGSLR